MNCPECSAQSDCIDSRQKAFVRRRRYECQSCKLRFTSVEVPIGVDFKGGKRGKIAAWITEIRNDGFREGRKSHMDEMRVLLGMQEHEQLSVTETGDRGE